MPHSHPHTTFPVQKNDGDVLCVSDLHFSYPDGHSALAWRFTEIMQRR